jgi:hypothetical protein
VCVCSALKVLEWHPALLFEVLDVNGDDRIDRQEYNAGFAMLDVNQDGFISREEFGAASAAAFDSLDRYLKAEYSSSLRPNALVA